MDYQKKASALFEDQKTSWPLLGANWEMLKAARIRELEFEGFSIQIQNNPKRIISSAAKVDRVSIENRSCFLCEENRPPEEKSVWFHGDYEILCNPFPIFREHFTLARKGHTPQVIEPEFASFLDLSRALYDEVVFYNAPACGASAPDHMHFQAGNRGFMPIEKEMGTLKQKYGDGLYRNSGLEVSAIEDGFRRFVLLESDNKALLEDTFLHIFRFVRGVQDGKEPMINMLSYFDDQWKVLIFPREKHRPRQYFDEGDKNILLSPAAVDMGGTLILPLEKDFLKISREDIEDIFSQISFTAQQFSELKQHLSTKLFSHD